MNKFSEIRQRRSNNENENLEQFFYNSKSIFLVNSYILRPIFRDF